MDASEREQYRTAIHGDRGAFEMVIRTHSRTLFAIAYGILQNREEDTTTAGLVAIYSDLLMLHALAVDHFQTPAEESIPPEEKKPEKDEQK